jgi:hypothetical protein
MLADRHIPDDDVRELARLVDEPTREWLGKALELGTALLALSIVDRMRVVTELRATVFLERAWRVREGLV